MKKLLLILPVILFIGLLGASCSAPTKQIGSNQPQVQSPNKVDIMVNNLDQSVSAEESAATESDADIITSDKNLIINSSEEVYNASQN